jgi:hypothetical protein
MFQFEVYMSNLYEEGSLDKVITLAVKGQQFVEDPMPIG